MSEPRLHVTFVCTNNICRSAMAEKMFAHEIRARGLDSHVRVSSAGTFDGWPGRRHIGATMMAASRNVLEPQGVSTGHRASALTADHLGADLVVALARNHTERLTQLGVPAERIRLLRSFDPRSGAHAPDVDDPFGFLYEFTRIHQQIRASLPGLHQWVDEQLAARGIATSRQSTDTWPCASGHHRSPPAQA
ncbi:protein tyrosine phosphatase [Mycolicibacterium pulveris]|uniref:arsenate reductase/protein-tyrosine-phosphatase family protein n=1 Tax=Mycolicibacterium pulveris TaxID=36813 RepID=UPI003CF55B1D